MSVWRFQVDGYPVCQLHAALYLVAFGARHDFQVDVTLKPVFFTQDGGGIDELVLGAQAAANDPRAQEHALGNIGLVESDERLCQLIRLEGCAAEISASAEWAVIAIALAGGGEQRLQQCDLLAVWQGGIMQEGIAAALEPGRAASVFSRLELHVGGECFQTIDEIHIMANLDSFPAYCPGKTIANEYLFLVFRREKIR
jgi:hypothetical protein